MGDLAVMLHAGMAPRRALWFNMLTSLTSVAGGLVGYFALREALEVLP
jgi:zinc and cadmium transporter